MFLRLSKICNPAELTLVYPEFGLSWFEANFVPCPKWDFGLRQISYFYIHREPEVKQLNELHKKWMNLWDFSPRQKPTEFCLLERQLDTAFFWYPCQHRQKFWRQGRSVWT